MIQIHTTKTPDADASEKLGRLLLQARLDGHDVLLLLAGGSAFKMYDLIDPSLLGPHVTLGMTDDRFTDDIINNNFATLQVTRLYNDTLDSGVWAIGSEPHAGETQEELRARYEFGIKKWLADFPKGKIIAVFGIGTDGHIAGIIPGVLSSEDFEKEFNGTQLVGKLDAADKNEFPLRISVTFPLIKNIAHAIVYATGDNKKEILKRVVDASGQVPLDKMPSRIIHEMKDVTLVTDQEL